MKYIRFLFILILSAAPSVTFAEIVITEIMYDPEGSDANREWIEVHNTGDEVLIEGGSGNTWRLYEESTKGALNKRTFNVESGASTLTLPHDSYAVMVKNASAFREDYPEFDSLLLISSLSLTNSEGRVLTIRDSEGREMSSPLLYTPLPEAGGTGASLQLQQNGQWIAGIPTPGEVNTTESFSLQEKEPAEEDVDDDFLQLESDWPFSKEALFLDAGNNQRVFVGETVTFQGHVRFKNGDTPRGDSPSWAFGDGEGKGGVRATHSYSHPGVYRAVLRVEFEGRFYQDSFLVHVIAVDEITLGEHSADFVELVNASTYEVELSGWTLRAEGEAKELAQGTFVLPLSSIRVPFVSDSRSIALYDTTGRRVGKAEPAPQSLSNDEIYKKILQELERMLSQIQER